DAGITDACSKAAALGGSRRRITSCGGETEGKRTSRTWPSSARSTTSSCTSTAGGWRAALTAGSDGSGRMGPDTGPDREHRLNRTRRVQSSRLSGELSPFRLGLERVLAELVSKGGEL